MINVTVTEAMQTDTEKLNKNAKNKKNMEPDKICDKIIYPIKIEH